MALIQAEPGGLRLSLALQLHLTGPERWDGEEQSWKAAPGSTYSLHGVFPLPLFLILSSAGAGH